MPAPTYVTAEGGGEYSGVGQTSRFDHRSGLVVVPRAAAGSTPKLVRVHGDYGMRVVKWETGRNGRPPLIPAQEDLTSDKYVGGTVDASLPVPDPINGSYHWRVSGQYVFFQAAGARLAGYSPLPTGAYPFSVQPQDAIAQELLKGASTGSGGYSNPLENLIGDLGRRLVNHNTLFPWPFSALPKEVGSASLIGG